MKNRADGPSKSPGDDRLCRERLDAVPDWIWEVDGEGNFEYTNRVVESVLGFAAAELIGSSMFDLLTPHDRTKCRELFRRATEACEPIRNVIAHYQASDGGIRTMEVSCVPILNGQGACVGLRGITRDITDHLHLQRTAEEALANYKAAVDNSLTGIVIIQNERVAYANPKMLEMMGYTLEEATSGVLWDFVHPDDVERVRSYYRQRMAGEPAPEQYQVRAVTKQGEVRYFELRATPITYRGAPAVLDNVIDCTDRVRGEERLTKLNDCFLGFGADAIENINRLTSLAGELLHADSALYNRLDEGMLCSWGLWRTPPGYNPVDRPEGHICYDVIRAGGDEVVVVRNLPESVYAETDPAVRAIGLRTYIGRPVRLGDRFVGSLCCVYQRDYEPSEHDKKLLGIIASAVAVEEKRYCAERELREREERFRGRLNAIETGVVVSDADGKILQVNRAASEFLEVSQEELVGRPVFDPGWQALREDGAPLPDDERPSTVALRTREAVRDVIIGVRGQISGRLRWLLLSAVPVFDPETGALVEVLTTLVDVTERKHAEEAMRESEAKFRDLVENLNDWVWKIDENGRLVYSSPGVRSLLGYSPDEVLGKCPRELIAPDEVEHATAITGEFLRRREPFSLIDLRFRRKDGTEAILRSNGTPIFDEQGGFRGYRGVSRDVTALVEAEVELRRRTSELEAVLNAFPDLYFWMDRDGTILDYHVVNESDLYRPADEFLGKPMQDVLPSDAARLFSAAIDEAVKSGSVRSVEYSLPIRGEETTFEARISPLPDDRLVVIVRNISERKRSEESLRESEERYRLLFERSPDMVFVLKDGRFIAANPAVTRVLGYKPEEVEGMQPGDISPELQPDGKRSDEKSASLLQGLREQDPLSFEWVHQRRDGTLLDCEVSLIAYRVHGEVHVQAIVRDVTERKRAEEHRRALERQLEAQKRQFYRETILSVTGGKLDICEPPEIRPYIASAEMKLTVPGAPEVAASRREVAEFCKEEGLNGERLESFMVGVGEAITNAVKHASGGRVYAGRRNGSVWVGVADRGPGIGSLILPRATLMRGFSTKPSLGLGYTIMLEVADSILLRTGTSGTTVILVKRIEEPEMRLSAELLPDTWQQIPDVEAD